jgi:hypothetical protein
MKIRNGHFVLELRHYHEGLTSEDMTAYAGMPVKVSSLSDFPYWDEFVKRRELPPEMTYERFLAMRTFSERYLGRIGLIDAYRSAQLLMDHLQFVTEPVTVLSKDAVANQDSARLLGGNASWCQFDGRRLVVPTSLLGNGRFNIEVPTRAIAFLNHNAMAIDEFWSLHTDLPKDRLTYMPDEKAQKLLVGVHEAAHSLQALPTEHMPPARTAIWLRAMETGADLTARAILRDQVSVLGNIDLADILITDLARRYAKILLLKPQHQIAPAIDAFESGRTLGFQPDSVVENISEGIFKKESGSLAGSFGPQEADDTFWLLQNTPLTGYSLLRRCVEDGEFDHMPNEFFVAKRILDAVEYFAEGLTFDRSIIRKIYAAGCAVK